MNDAERNGADKSQMRPKLLYLDTWAIRQLTRRRDEPAIRALIAKLAAGNEWRLVVSSLNIYELVRGVATAADCSDAESAAALLDECRPLITATVPSKLRDAEVEDEVLALLGLANERTARLRLAETFQEAASEDADAVYWVGAGSYRGVLDAVRGYLSHPQSLETVRVLQARWLDDAKAITPALLSSGVKGSRDWFERVMAPGYLSKEGLLPPIIRRILERHLPRRTPAGLELDPVAAKRELDRACIGNIPTVAIELRFLARRLVDSKELEESFVLDVMHASLAIPHTDVAVLDGQAAEYLREARLPPPTATVLKSLDDAVDLVVGKP